MSSRRITLAEDLVTQIAERRHFMQRGCLMVSVAHDAPEGSRVYLGFDTDHVTVENSESIGVGDGITLTNSQLAKSACVALHALAVGGEIDVIVTETV